jgi:ribose 5-phosphate isomerase A
MNDSLKRILAQHVAARVQNKEIIGIGTGTTVDAVISEIGSRISRESLKVSAVVTSYESSLACHRAGITVLDPLAFRGEFSWGFDGADEVDEKCRLIKGKGGAMLREKILASRCREYLILVENHKIVANLGRSSFIPIEVVPEAYPFIPSKLNSLGALEIKLRDGKPSKHGPVITEHGNLVVDARFSSITDGLEKEINQIVGVVENGIFTSFATEILVAEPSGIRIIQPTV